jgi:hypothetical protein
MFTQAQLVPSQQGDSWTIRLSNKLLLNTKQENESANTKRIAKTEWAKNGYLEISYKAKTPKAWKRSFLFFDKEDNQLLMKENVTSVKISIASLRKIFTGKDEIRIYTIASPADPAIAVRIRRVHLCTLQLI